jgi:hypothetical protein
VQQTLTRDDRIVCSCRGTEGVVRVHGRVTGFSLAERARQRKPHLPLGRHKIHPDQREVRRAAHRCCPPDIVGY